jgi:hypothetical protein
VVPGLTYRFSLAASPSQRKKQKTERPKGPTAALDAREDLVKLPCNTLVGKASQVPALRTVCPPLQRSRRWVVGASG